MFRKGGFVIETKESGTSPEPSYFALCSSSLQRLLCYCFSYILWLIILRSDGSIESCYYCFLIMCFHTGSKADIRETPSPIFLEAPN